MLYIDGKENLNINEQIRQKLKSIIELYVDDPINALYIKLQDIKKTNIKEYYLMIQNIYKEVYMYINYTNKLNENTRQGKDYIKECFNAEDDIEVVETVEDNLDFFLDYYNYLLQINDLFRIKMFLELNESQNRYLNRLSATHLYDLLALKNYIGLTSLEEYYENNIEYDYVEDIVNDIIFFLDDLYYKQPDVYDTYIREILFKYYKWCCYYKDHSIEIEKTDPELKILDLFEKNDSKKIHNILKDDINLFTHILITIFDNMELGYPSILTEDGDQLVNEEQIDNYIKHLKK